MKPKKILRKLALLLLTSGASLILGFLSFGGMFALWSILPLAFASFGLSVIYEGQVYWQNIKEAWNKLFKSNHLERQLSNDYLLNNFPDTNDKDCPQFFKDYETQLSLLDSFGLTTWDRKGRALKKKEEKVLRDMEKWFSVLLFSSDEAFVLGESPYKKYKHGVCEWFSAKETEPQKNRNKIKQLLLERQSKFRWAAYFSLLAGGFMSLGTSYLLMGSLSVIPWFASLPLFILPLMIVPMSMIAGVAYGFLTYNAVTDMISNDSYAEWKKDLTKDLSFHTLTAWLLVSLAVALTVCTAGTWWTVVKETKPLFKWMARLPGFVMGVINPLITGLSAVVFNLENTRESLQMILKMMAGAGGYLNSTAHYLTKYFIGLRQRENPLQIINPFRLFIILTLVPLRIVLFMGHLLSIGVTADRVPGVPQRASALMGIISEFFEDLHRFFSYECPSEQKTKDKKQLREERLGKEQGRHQDLDIPTQLLEGIYSILGLYYLSSGWDWAASQLFNSKEPLDNEPAQLTWAQALEKGGFRREKDSKSLVMSEKPSADWRLVHIVHRIERFKQKELSLIELNGEEGTELTEVQTTLSKVGSPLALRDIGFFNSAKINAFFVELAHQVGEDAFVL
jgi:hypothetical protein